MRKSLAVAMSLAMVLNVLIPVVRPMTTWAEPAVAPSHAEHRAGDPVPNSPAPPAITLFGISSAEAGIIASTVPISITESGFDPDTVTITVGTTVEWTNRTQETVRLVSGEPYRIYLPLVLRNLGDAIADDSYPMSPVLVHPQGDWGNMDIASGESFTHTFTAGGGYPYFLAEYLDRVGHIVVQETSGPDFALAIAPASQTVTQGQFVTYTVMLTATNGFTAPVTLSTSGLPVNAQAAWSANPITPTGSVVLTVATTIGAPTGDHLFTIAGTGGGQSHDAQTTLTVEASTAPDFLLDAWPATQTITRGHSVTYTVGVTAVNGFTRSVSLAVDNTPTGATVAWATNPLTPTADTTLTITPSASGPTGTFTLVITGTSNPTHTAQVELVIVDESVPSVPDFLLDATPDSRSVAQGQTTSYDVSLTAIYGFSDAVTLEVDGLPADATPDWGENPITPSDGTVLTITTAETTPAGNYTLTITGTGGGISRTDSVQLSVTPPPMPNLGVQTLSTDPEIPVAGQPCQIQVRIANTGNAYASGNFGVDAYLDPATPPTLGATGDFTWMQANLGAGGVQTLNAVYTFTTAGLHMLYAQVDTTDIITESDESDNVTGPLTLTISATPQPELLITTMSIEPLTPTLGHPATLTVQVKNRGTLSTTTAVRVDGYVTATMPGPGQTGDIFTTTPPLDPGQSIAVQLPYTFTLSGLRTVYVQVDALNTIAESIEDNNVTGPLTVTVRVPQPDLVIESITFNPTVGWINETVTVTVRVRNQGDTDAGAFRADWYIDPAIPPSTGQTGDGYWDVSGLAVGATMDLTLTHSFAMTGTHWVYAQVDTLEAIMESEESINVDGESLIVVNQAENVCGGIAENTTWVGGRVYYITCNVMVNNSVTLTIEPGTAIRFNSNYAINVHGSLSAQGVPTRSILFTSNSDTPIKGDWAGILVQDGGSAILDHIVLRYATWYYFDYIASIYVADGGTLHL
ncbi:MAG: hypothetical protein GY832_26615, partial [Chloroflexi bacterium]|nr:hypothetical protein [Chloroflexota bacterium]